MAGKPQKETNKRQGGERERERERERKKGGVEKTTAEGRKEEEEESGMHPIKHHQTSRVRDGEGGKKKKGGEEKEEGKGSDQPLFH